MTLTPIPPGSSVKADITCLESKPAAARGKMQAYLEGMA